MRRTKNSLILNCTFASLVALVPQLAVAQAGRTPATAPGSPTNGVPGQRPPMSDQTPQMDTGSSKMMAKSPDMTFADKAAQGGMAEVQLGKLAAEKGSDPDVKAFGQQMVDDHSKANDKLMSIAKDQNMTLPSNVNAKQQAMYNSLDKLSGADFDKAYVKDMVKDHQEDVKEFQKEANAGKNPQLKSFASDTLPVIQGHLDKVKSIQPKLGTGKSTGSM